LGARLWWDKVRVDFPHRSGITISDYFFSYNKKGYFFIPDFALTQKSCTNSCAQNSGITPPEAQNLEEILPGGPTGEFCFAKLGFIKFYGYPIK